MAGPARRLGILTGAAALALTLAAVFGDSGPHASRQPGSITPAGVEVVPEGGICSGAPREIVLRGLGRPIKVELDADEGGRDRSLVRRRPPTGEQVRDQWELVVGDRCPPPPPCPRPERGLTFSDPRACADR